MATVVVPTPPLAPRNAKTWPSLAGAAFAVTRSMAARSSEPVRMVAISPDKCWAHEKRGRVHEGRRRRGLQAGIPQHVTVSAAASDHVHEETDDVRDPDTGSGRRALTPIWHRPVVLEIFGIEQ